MCAGIDKFQWRVNSCGRIDHGRCSKLRITDCKQRSTPLRDIEAKLMKILEESSVAHLPPEGVGLLDQ